MSDEHLRVRCTKNLTTIPAVIYYRPELDITQTIQLIYDQMATMEEDHLATAAE